MKERNHGAGPLIIPNRPWESESERQTAGKDSASAPEGHVPAQDPPFCPPEPTLSRSGICPLACRNPPFREAGKWRAGPAVREVSEKPSTLFTKTLLDFSLANYVAEE